MISRRALLANATCVLAAPLINRGRFRLSAATTQEYSTSAIDLVTGSTVIDMLGLLTLNYRKLSAWQTQPKRFQPADLQALKASGTTIFHPAVGFTEGDVFMSSLNDITRWNLFLEAYPGDFTRIDGSGDLERAKTEGKIGIVIGQQNSQHFRTVDDVDYFYNLGQRVSQLTYNDNRIGGGSTDGRNPGLTEYGAAIVARMNHVGMAVDVSHCADRTTLEAIEASTKPVLVTHSNCRALVPGTARCKTDEAIRKLAAKDGVMGVTMVRSFVASGAPVTLEKVLDHIDRVKTLVGVEHVGLGTDVDLDGRDQGPTRRYDLDGIRYSKKIFDVTEGLIRRGYSRADIELFLGGNFQRSLSQIWGRPGPQARQG